MELDQHYYNIITHLGSYVLTGSDQLLNRDRVVLTIRCLTALYFPRLGWLTCLGP